MINKFILSIRKQDWFTVVIEIFIIVIGIYIALQVDNWNQSRLRQANIELQLSLIEEDARFMYENTEKIIEVYDQRTSAFQFVIGILDGNSLTKANQEKFNQTLISSYKRMELDLDFPGLEQLTASGELKLIKDEHVRLALIDFINSRRSQDLILSHIRETLNMLTKDIFQALTHDIVDLKTEESKGAIFKIRYNLEELRKNALFRKSIGNTALMHAHTRGVMLKLNRKLGQIINVLEERLYN